jgi:imidazole glycerol phosphate synthase glutamine amidotransferase subunit
MTLTVDLIDYGGGNIGSISRCLHRLGVDYRMVSPKAPPQGDRPLVLPGVGAFGAVMRQLRREGFDERIAAIAKSGTPFLGVCVGLQVLLEGSEESLGVAGLGLVPGTVVRFREGKIPQIGWNYLTPKLKGDWEPGYVYFVNSYYARPDDPQAVLYEADYHGPFCAAIRRENITAFQFHPEKSGHFGHELIRRWLNDC